MVGSIVSACAIERDLSQFVMPLYFQLFMLQDGRIEWASDAGFVKAIEVGQQCQPGDHKGSPLQWTKRLSSGSVTC